MRRSGAVAARNGPHEPARVPAALQHSGFCVGGVHWPRPELLGVPDAERRQRVREIAAREARLTHELGGDLLRLFFSVESSMQMAPADAGIVLGVAAHGDKGVYAQPLEVRAASLDRADVLLDHLLAAIAEGPQADCALDLSWLDDYIAGVEAFNRDAGGTKAGVRVLLTLVSPAPRWIVEAPGDATLQALGRDYTFASLWDRYLRVHSDLHRLLVRRYVAERTSSGEPATVCAFELGNEPDYIWVPEETKIETVADGRVYPLAKYVTELQLAQVPEHEEQAPAFEATAWGFQAQDGPWRDTRPHATTPVCDFDWGVKFDWYVRCFTDLHVQLADAIAQEAAAHDVEVTIVSASVTHNNIDYLVRMQRANPRAFALTTKIGIHPYHWVHNDVWDDRFVDPGSPTSGWEPASPRSYASDYFKRFDFLEQLAACVRGDPRPRALRRLAGRGTDPHQPGPAMRELAAALAGKKLWITEFGIGTKTLGAFNEPVAEHTRFIRARHQVGAAAGHDAAIWEDLWEAFLSQVADGYLPHNEVECVLLYALREAGLPHLDMDDDDRSNLALLRRDGSPRLDPPTLDALGSLLGTLSGKQRSASPAAPRAGLELHRRPWRAATPPADVLEVMTMLSHEERQLLFWLASTWYSGAGAIVDGGCFVGGSSLALAEGLRANPNRPAGALVEVFDLFEVEPYMIDLYFSDWDFEPGDSFRPVFDRNTEPVRDLLRVTEGDLALHGWDGRPIEVLFVDIAKSWSLNDLIVEQFFSALIPDRSVVVQQDMAFAYCPWVAITMELLADYFEPVSFAEYNSVVYVCRRQVPRDVLDGPLQDLALDAKLELMDRAIARFRGYPRGYLELARTVLMVEGGERTAARTQLGQVRERHHGEPLVLDALASVETLLV
jgi:hypothetical protein